MESVSTVMAGKAHCYVQELIKALQTGGSRSKMEAAITIRSLAASHNLHQVALIAAGGLRPLVDLLSYEAKETQWPPDMRQKATITVRAEAALALASLSLSNDENKTAIGSTGAIPLLCDLIKFDEEEAVRSNLTAMAKAHHKQQQSDPFLILARDAGVGALSCLAKNEANKSAIVRANAVPNLVRMVDQGTAFGKAAAANVLAKVATGDNPENKFLLAKEGAIPALLRLIQEGSSKARESAAEALTNLATNSWNQAVIIKEGGVGCFLKMAESSTLGERDAAMRALKAIQLPRGTTNFKLGHVGSRGESGGGLIAEYQKIPITMNNGQKNIFMEGSARATSQNNQQKKFVSIVTKASTNTNSWATESSSTRSPLTSTHPLFATELTSSMAPPLLGQPSIHANSTLGGYSRDTAALEQQQQCCSRKRLKVSHFSGRHNFLEFGQQKSYGNACQMAPAAANEIYTKSQTYCCINNVGDCQFQGRFPCGNAAAAGKKMSTNSVSTNQTLESNKTMSGALSKFASICASRGEAGVEADQPQHQESKCSTIDSTSASAEHNDPDFEIQTVIKQFGDRIPLNQSRREFSTEQSTFSGISALVNALSTENFGAQEFAALALMLLASQGGNEVKTMIANAGALSPLIAMAQSSSSPMIRESAASAIAKLVSCHPANRENLVRNRGVQALVEMAKWSTVLLDGGAPLIKPEDKHKVEEVGFQEGNSSTLAARLQAAAIVAILSVSEVLDEHSVGLTFKDALLSLVHMLESKNCGEIEAGIGGLHALSSSLGMEQQRPKDQILETESHIKREAVSKTQSHDQDCSGPQVKARKYGCIAAELVTSLLNLMRGSSIEAHKAAAESLASLRRYNGLDHHRTAVNVDAAGSYERASCKALSDSEATPSVLEARDCSDGLMDALRKEGLDAMLLLLGDGTNINVGIRELVVDALAYVVDSEKLHNHLVEPFFVSQLMSILRDERSTTMIKIMAAAAIANFGSKRKRLSTISADDFPILFKLLLDDQASEDQCNFATTPNPSHIDIFNSPQIKNFFHMHSTCTSTSTLASCCCGRPCQPYPQAPTRPQLLKEHVAAILVYNALAGEEQKQALIAAGAVPAFVQTLQGSTVHILHPNMPLPLPSIFQCSSFLRTITPAQDMSNGVLLSPQATQEFAIIGLILLADKNVKSMEKIVNTGAIPTLVKLLFNVYGRGRLGASWSEMAAVALLTLARCESARDEIVRAGGVTAVVHILKGDSVPFVLSLTGLAAMAKLLGILAMNNSLETKVQMAKTGAVRCLVKILMGDGCLAWATEVVASSCTQEGLSLLALAQEAAASALASVVLQCPENAEAAVEAGAIVPLVRLIGPHAGSHAYARADQEEAFLEPERDPENNSESGGSSSTTTDLTNDNFLLKERPIRCNLDTPASCHGEGGDLCNNINNSLGPPLAALSALGNLIPCFPQSGLEIVNAGGLAKLISFLHAHGKKIGNLGFHNTNFKTKFGTLTHLSSHPCYPKILENAASVLGLLAEANDEVQEAVTCTGVLHILRELFPSAKLATSASSKSVMSEGQNQKDVGNTAHS